MCEGPVSPTSYGPDERLLLETLGSEVYSKAVAHGYIPADDPRYVVAVNLERPTRSAEGCLVDAPGVAQVMREALSAGGRVCGPACGAMENVSVCPAAPAARSASSSSRRCSFFRSAPSWPADA